MISDVDQEEGQIVQRKKIGCFFLVSDKQRLEAIDPSEAALIAKSPFVDFPVEMPFSSSLGLLAATGIFRDVGPQRAVPEHFTELSRVEASVCIEEPPAAFQSAALHVAPDFTEVASQISAVIAIARQNVADSQDKALSFNDTQNI